jgi:hypothetical protein
MSHLKIHLGELWLHSLEKDKRPLLVDYPKNRIDYLECLWEYCIINGKDTHIHAVIFKEDFQNKIGVIRYEDS